VTGLRPSRSGSALVTRGLYEEALKVIPGGVNSPVRSMAAIGRDPIFIERGEGAELVDTDGKRYVDWVCSWGPLIAGHAHPDVVDAVKRAAERGTSYGAPTAAETELAQAIVERMRSVEMVRLVNSGTEATMSALRVARAATAAIASSSSQATTTGTSTACWCKPAPGSPPRGYPQAEGCHRSRRGTR